MSRGASVFPFPFGDKEAAEQATAAAGATLAKPRKTAGGQFSLSPRSLMTAESGLKLMLPSPNGSRLTLEIKDRPVLAGCLRNARAVAAAARQLAADGTIAVIQAGERWPDGSLRPALEDMLGAGAILHHLGLAGSAEAEMARDAFCSVGGRTADHIRRSMSGRELSDAGYAGDVEIALEQNVSNCAPLLADGAYRAV